MRKLLAIAIFCISCTIVFAEDAIVGVFIHSPNILQDETTKKAVGPAIDYINAVLKDMGYTSVVKILPFPRVISSLQSGEIDITLEIGKNAKREAFLYYPDQSCYTMKPSLAVVAGNKLNKIATIDDVSGMTIGFLKGATTHKFFENQSSVKFDLISGDDWLKKNLAKLLAGRIDAAFDQNAFSYLVEAKKQGTINKIKILPLPGDGTSAYTVFSKKSPKGKALLDGYNKILASGKYDLNQMISDSVSK